MTQTTDIPVVMADMGRRARAAAETLATADSAAKTAALIAAAEAVWEARETILEANSTDLAYGAEKGLGDAMMDRLTLTEDRIKDIMQGLLNVAKQRDPVGRALDAWDMPSGLGIERVCTPLGVVGVIYESRPNVTADAGALCLKAGNAVILRGGSESLYSSTALHGCLVAGLRAADLPVDAIQLVPTRDRAAVSEMLTMTDSIDVIVPRGGKGLVGLVQREARVPVFAHLEGIVHIYIDKAADPEKALKVVLNAKTRRTGICGAAECLLIHEDIRGTIGQGVVRALMDAGVRVHGDQELQTLEGVIAATEADWGREYLDMDIAARVVSSQDEAVAHIRRYGSQHTDCILTEDAEAAAAFLNDVDSAIVMHNASTQFADGGEFGMGAEIGIATGKLHARGPVGADQLTSFKYKVTGHGTVRS